MAGAFDAATLDRRYAFLDDCPEALVPAVVTLPVGRLADRVPAVRRWRDDLLAGREPGLGSTWPPCNVGAPVSAALHELGIASFCKDQPELVDVLLADVLEALRRQAELDAVQVALRLRALEDRARLREQPEHSRAKRARARRRRPMQIDPDTLDRLRHQAENETRSRPPDPELLEAWASRARAWAEIAAVFGDLGQMLGRGWDLSMGVLRHTGWLDLLRLAKLVEQLDAWRAVIRALGRLHAPTDGPSAAESIFVPVRRLEEELLEVRTPQAPTETRGVERSGCIARMLPVEAALLGHPTLRKLWHARRAERALLSYRVEGVLTERVWAEREVLEEQPGQRPRPERGPIIAIVDTSGSMHGLPEQVAKAVVLEALRTAHHERRRCFLYAYSGPGQIIEHELDLTPEGIGRLLAFLGFSFHGGNDEAGMLVRVLERLRESEWSRADVLFVSDGEWPAPAAVVARVEQAKQQGTRFHGVQIGNRGRTGLHAVCEPVHEFGDWATLAGWQD